MTRTLTAHFATVTATRRTELAHTHASRTEAGRVRFHGSEAAARRAAGRFGEVVRTDLPVEAAAPERAPGFLVTFTDGTSVEVGMDRPPLLAAREACPGRTPVGATRV